MHQDNCTPIYIGNKVVGKVKGDVFYKFIRGSKHILKKPPAIAFDIDSLIQAERAGAVWVQITDCESRTIYRATIRHIREKGGELDRGFGRQIFLPMNGWIKSRTGDATQLVLTL